MYGINFKNIGLKTLNEGNVFIHWVRGKIINYLGDYKFLICSLALLMNAKYFLNQPTSYNDFIFLLYIYI